MHRREGTQGPRCEKLTEWRRGAFSLLQSCCGNCCTIAIVSALEVKFPVSPVSLRDGEFLWTGLFFMQWRGLLGLWLQVFLEYTATDAFTYSKHPWSHRGSRGYAPMGADSWDCSLLCAVYQMLSLYSHSQRTCRPQPRGGGGDATSRQDTRQDRWLYFEFQLRWSPFLCVF